MHRTGGGAGVGFGLGWGWGIVRALGILCLLLRRTAQPRGACAFPADALCSGRPQGWGSKIINTKQAFPRKGESLLESAQAAAADAMSALQGASVTAAGKPLQKA